MPPILYAIPRCQVPGSASTSPIIRRALQMPTVANAISMSASGSSKTTTRVNFPMTGPRIWLSPTDWPPPGGHGRGRSTPVSIITTESLTRRYGRRTGIADMDLRVPEGILFGFLGPNGAGKTTTIRVLLGFLRPTAGRASVFGLDCWRNSSRIKADVGYLPGDLRLPSWGNGGEAPRIFGMIRRRDMLRQGPGLGERFAPGLGVRGRGKLRGMRQKPGPVLGLGPRPTLPC